MRDPCTPDLTIQHRRRGDTVRRFGVAELRSADTAAFAHLSKGLDVWRAAELYLRQHDNDAEMEVAHQVTLLRAAGDKEGVQVWVCIYDTISHIRRQAWASTLSF